MPWIKTSISACVLALAMCAAPAAAQESPPPQPGGSGGSIVVPGERPGPVTPADPRTTSERMRDIRAWDRCVLRAQRLVEDDPFKPQLETPEELCQRSLGMADRTAIPISRQGER